MRRYRKISAEVVSIMEDEDNKVRFLAIKPVPATPTDIESATKQRGKLTVDDSSSGLS